MSFEKTLILLFLVFANLVNLVYASDSEPIYINNTLPIMHGVGLSAPKSAQLNDNETEPQWSWLVSANLQSHANDSGSASESLIIDGEVHQLAFATRWNFAPNWQFGADLSFIRNTSGSLDNAIREWHELFDLDQGDRDDLLDDQFLYQYSNDLSNIELSESVSGVSDTELTLSYQFYTTSKMQLAAHLSANLPTGSSEKVTGSDKTDVKLSLAMGWQTDWNIDGHINAEYIAIGDSSLFNIPTRSNTWAASTGMHWQASNYWRWSIQLDGHGRVFDSEVEEISQSAWQFALASQYKQWQIYFSEDITVNRAADFSFGINWLSNF